MQQRAEVESEYREANRQLIKSINEKVHFLSKLRLS